MDSEHGRESSKHQRVTKEAIVNLKDSFEPSSAVDFEHTGEIRTNLDYRTSEEVATSTTQNSKSSNSVSSSSSENSSDDFFQVDPLIIPTSKTSDHNVPTKSTGNTQPPLRDGKTDVYSGPLYQLEEIFGSSSSNSPVSDVTHESCIPISTITQSPPIQVMERPKGFDPDRIPASIFTKPASPVDWSAASDESLFSIQIGNPSFSRDHAFFKLAGDANKPNEIGKSGELYASKESYKSGELDKLSELYLSGELRHSNELVRFKQPSPVTEGEHKSRNFDLGKTEAFEKPKENLSNKTTRDKGEINVEDNHRLDETRTNSQSSAFPIKKKSSKSSRICKNCSCKLCSCKWPCCSSCSCKCPTCSCKCPSCSGCCCRWPSCSGCCCRWPSCSSCTCKWPSCSSCCCRWPSCSGCCCRWPSCSRCTCMWPSCSSCTCKRPSCSSCCCKWPCCSNSSCKWPSCSSCCCKSPCFSCKGLSWPSCSCKWLCSPSCSGCCCKFKSGCCKSLSWPSCHCKCPTWPSCHCSCSSWSCCSFKCSSWSSCCSKSHCSNCCWTSCNSWKCAPKKFCC